MPVRRKIRGAVVDHVEALRSAGRLDGNGEVLALVALRLAGLLDDDPETKSAAGWARELRAALVELKPKEEAGDGNPDAWLDDLDGSVTPIRHAQGS